VSKRQERITHPAAVFAGDKHSEFFHLLPFDLFFALVRICRLFSTCNPLTSSP
jgi:hypothetical protein